TRPLMRSGNAGPMPRYCTATISMPVIVLNSSPKSPELLPAPDDAMSILPAWAFAWAMNSLTVFAGDEGPTTIARRRPLLRRVGRDRVRGFPVSQRAVRARDRLG